VTPIDRQKKHDFAEKILLLTIEEKLKWMRVSSNIDLYDSKNRFVQIFLSSYDSGMYTYKYKKLHRVFDLNESYFCEFQNGRIYLFRYMYSNDSIEILAVQTKNDSKLIAINTPQERNNPYSKDMFIRLRELSYHVSNSIDDAGDFIDSILGFND